MLSDKKKQALTRYKFLAYLSAGIIILIVLHKIGILAPVENVAIKTFTPIRTSLYEQTQRYSHIFGNWQTITELEKENDKLNDKISHLTSQINSLLALGAENEELRKQLNLQPKKIKELVEAKPIEFVNDLTDNFMIVDVGFKEGLSAGLPAILYDALIGTVDSTTAHSARINLITNPNNPVQVSIQGKPEAKGIIKGSREQNLLLLSNIKRSIDLEIGDQVITSGKDIDQFNNLLVGSIIEELTQNADTEKSFKIEPTLKIRPVDRVFVILP